MKKLVYLVIAVAVMFCVAIPQEKPWFDLKNCAFCKEIDAQPDLIKHMNSEYHNIDGGFISITQIDKEYQAAYDKTMEGMKKVATDMGTAGKIPPMCQHCSKYGDFLMAGVHDQYINSAFGHIFLMTSADTAVATRLQAFAARTAQETEKFKAELKAE